ncbi:hypothetical protein [Sphingobium sp. CCH11-B1]|jgi:hypothetical protein|uniref:hypothetical protein n=1 Tax=Sphingobium sp. CCH11-B1 TaxID=1768781 RepID=UPI00082D64E3|nr:hypothetical protein [Sphingobium sp. CCH11-B1]MEA3389605.1 hypothetical protein [Pseudomonadota bacterium]
MIRTNAWAIATAIFICAPAQAQNIYYFAAPEAATAPGPRYVLPAGTPIMLRTTAQISSKDNLPGERIRLEVAEPIVFGHQTIIPAGSPAFAEVAMTQRNGHFGRKGKIEIQLVEVMTPYGPARLTGSGYDEGKSGTAASIGTMLFLTSLGFLIHGTSGYIPAGTVVNGQLNSDLRFRYAAEGAPVAVASAADR